MKTVWIINQYASTPETGFGGRNFYFAKELAKLGYKVYLFSSSTHHLLRKKPYVKKSYYLEEIEGFNFVWIKLPEGVTARSIKRVMNWFIFSFKLFFLHKKILDKPDIVIHSSPPLISFLSSNFIAKKYNSKLIFEVRDIWPLSLIQLGGYSKNHPFIKFCQWIEDKAYRESDIVISNLKNSNVHMEKRGMDPSKFMWIPNGFSLDEINLQSPLDIHISDQIPNNKFIVGYTGTFNTANSLDTLVDAAEILKKSKNIFFILVGGGQDRVLLDKKIKSKNIENIIIIDTIPKIQIQAMLSNFDALYMGMKKHSLYHYGVSPNKLYDYLYASKPILYCIESGDYNPIKDDFTGYNLPAENPVMLANKILHLSKLSKLERSRMGENCKALALQEYEYGKLVNKLIKAFS